jgi:hypothetical protein
MNSLDAFALAFPAHRYTILLTKDGKPIDEPATIGTFPIDEGCGADALNSGWVEAYLAAGHPVLFAFESAKDLGVILSRITSFEARGYRVVNPATPATGVAQ